MSYLGTDVCARCFTTHPLDENGERPCPKPPIEERESGPDMTFILKGSGWYSVDKRVIRTASDVHGTGID